MILPLLGSLLAVPLVSPPESETVTPSHVYQVLEQAHSDVIRLLKADFVDERPIVQLPPDFPERRPRHVIQKVRQLHERVNHLREMNGLEPTRVEALPIRKILPVDVMEFARSFQSSLSDLQPVYGIEATPRPRLLPGKKPTDCYVLALRIDRMLTELGVPTIVPNDVYRIADALLDETVRLAGALGVEPRFELTLPAGRVKPTDVFVRGLELLDSLDGLSRTRPALAIEGGVKPLPFATGVIAPSDVANLMSDALADTSAIRARLGGTDPPRLRPTPVGKTPANVLALLNAAIDVLDQVRAGSAGR